MSTVNVPPPNSVRVLDNQGWVGLIQSMGSESTITNAARVSFGKYKNTFDEKDEQLLKYLIENKHNTPMEHVVFTFTVHCPLFVRSQWHRHRTWSYNEISRRYTEEEIELYYPKLLRKQSDNNKQASTSELIENNQDVVNELRMHDMEALAEYKRLLAKGVCREQARGVLPQNLMTTFWATVDLSNLIHFLELREDKHAQVEIREYAKAIKQLIHPLVPHVCDYYGWFKANY